METAAIEARVKKLGRYEVLGELAVGGMAEILLARVRGPSNFERPVVIKRILRNLAGDAEFVNMFLDEARTVSRIRHPNVVSIHELGRERDELFMVMDYEEGENAAALFKAASAANDLITPLVAAHVVAGACAGLHAAHEAVDEEGRPLGLVHRDVSPQNLILTYDGHVKVLDFGIALSAARKARTQAGQLKGKLAYMSPEQASGKPLDRRSDVFCLGTILYELSTMRRLFDRDSDLATLQAISEPVVPPSRVVEGDYPDALDRICMRALELDPADRYQTAEEMRIDLVRYMRDASSAEPRAHLEGLMGRFFSASRKERGDMLRALESDTGPSSTRSLDTLPPAAPRPKNRHAVLVGSLVGAALGVPVVAFLALKMRPSAEETREVPSSTIEAQPTSSQVPTASVATKGTVVPEDDLTIEPTRPETPQKPVRDLRPRGKLRPRLTGTSGATQPVAPSATPSFHRFD